MVERRRQHDEVRVRLEHPLAVTERDGAREVVQRFARGDRQTRRARRRRVRGAARKRASIMWNGTAHRRPPGRADVAVVKSSGDFCLPMGQLSSDLSGCSSMSTSSSASTLCLRRARIAAHSLASANAMKKVKNK